VETRLRFNPTVPFNSLPPLPVERAAVETLNTLRKSLQATAALAELKGISHTLRNPNILLNAVILREAKASSAIENIVTTHDKLYRSLNLKGKDPDAATWEVLRYREAVKHGLSFIEDKGFLHMRIVADIQKVMEMNDAGIRKLPGTRLLNAATGEPVYTPPDDTEVMNALLQNYDEHYNSKDSLCPLIRMAVLHHQFESIHPFYDGNGRTGRILNLLFLLLHGLLDAPVLYMSGYIVRNKNDYYHHLQAVRTQGNWEPWIIYMLDAVEQSSRETIQKIQDINQLLHRTHDEMKQATPKLYSRELADLLFEQPYCRIEHVMQRMDVSRITASKYLRELVKAGFVQREVQWKESLFINHRMMSLLGDW
jgi:Fic family protein